MRLAAERGLHVGVRSGGHSWIANGVRHGGLTIDLSALSSVAYDPRTQIVAVGPAARSADIDAELARHDRFFPTGHAPSVGVGGFLIGGGYGWNSRVYGPACLNAIAADVVLADGRLVRADEDVLWALRGCGPGFFGVAVRASTSAPSPGRSGLAPGSWTVGAVGRAAGRTARPLRPAAVVQHLPERR